MNFTPDQLKIMDSIIARYPRSRSAVMPLLHYVQALDGYVTPRGIEKIAELLEISTAEVTAVSSFYTQYRTEPAGEYHVGVCINTLCAVMGGDAIYDSLETHLGIKNHETTAKKTEAKAKTKQRESADFGR